MEILVHVSAPSSRKDDLDRAKQAQSYPSFSCTRRHDINASAREAYLNNSKLSEKSQSLLHPQLHPRGFLRSDAPSFVQDTQLAVSALESQLYSPVVEKPVKPVSRRHTRSSQGPHAHHAPSPVVLYQESFDSSTRGVSRQKRKQSAVPLQGQDIFTASPGPVDRTKDHDHAQSPPGPIVRQSPDSRWSASDDLPDQLPSTYSVSDGASALRNTPSKGATVTTPSQAVVHHQTTQSATKRPINVPEQSKSTTEEQDTTHISSPISSQVEPRRVTTGLPPPSTKDPTDPQAMLALLRLPRMLRPEQPTTSIDTFITHVTSALETLISNADLAPRYAPSTVSRELRQHERGYWSFNVDPWTNQAQLAFWTFMRDIMLNGSAGWGVWCAASVSSNDGEKGTQGLGNIHVFCWGQVVPHVYLLLYVASKSRIKRLACQWIDADGEVVVQM